MELQVEAVPSKEGERMADITNVKATALYASGEVIVEVDATGQYPRDGIELVAVPPPDDCCQEGTVLVVAITFTQGTRTIRRWATEKSFKYRADYVVLMYAKHVLAVRPVDNAEARRVAGRPPGDQRRRSLRGSGSPTSR